MASRASLSELSPTWIPITVANSLHYATVEGQSRRLLLPGKEYPIRHSLEE
jgi:hypothetical protein